MNPNYVDDINGSDYVCMSGGNMSSSSQQLLLQQQKQQQQLHHQQLQQQQRQPSIVSTSSSVSYVPKMVVGVVAPTIPVSDVTGIKQTASEVFKPVQSIAMPVQIPPVVSTSPISTGSGGKRKFFYIFFY